MLLSIIFFVVAALAVVAVYLAAPALSLWWIWLLYPAAWLSTVLLFLAYLLLSTLFMPQKKHPAGKSNRYARCMMYVMLDWVLRLLGVRYTVTGREKLPSVPCVLIGNHRSDFDPMITFAALRGVQLSYISKKENFRIPIAGPYICYTGFLPLDRQNPLRAARTIKEGARLIREEGVTMGIYPEGTRSKKGELLPFKEGAFRMAKMAGAPIAVLITRNTEQVAHNFFRRRTHVPVEILGVIDAETVARATTAELSAMARDMMASALA